MKRVGVRAVRVDLLLFRAVHRLQHDVNPAARLMHQSQSIFPASTRALLERRNKHHLVGFDDPERKDPLYAIKVHASDPELERAAWSCCGSRLAGSLASRSTAKKTSAKAPHLAKQSRETLGTGHKNATTARH